MCSSDLTSSQDDECVYTTKKNKQLKGVVLIDFLRFWEAFDYKKGKAEAADSWWTLKPKGPLINIIVNAAVLEARGRKTLLDKGRTPKMAQGWLSGKRWEDYEAKLKDPRDQEAKQKAADDRMAKIRKKSEEQFLKDMEKEK